MTGNADYGALIQVGWILSDDLAAEGGIDRTSNDYIFTLETAEHDGGVLPEYADRLVPIFRLPPNRRFAAMTDEWTALAEAAWNVLDALTFTERYRIWTERMNHALVALGIPDPNVSPNDGSRP